jgi:hypothetical protein
VRREARHAARALRAPARDPLRARLAVPGPARRVARLAAPAPGPRHAMTRGTRARALALAKLVLAGGVLWLLIAAQPVGDYLALWQNIAILPVMAAFALALPLIGLRVWQTRHLARLQGMALGVGDLLRLHFAIAFYSLFLPGVLATGAVRWYRLARLGGKGAATLAMLVFSRLLEIEATLAIGLMCWLADARAPGGSALGAAAFGGALLAAALAHRAAFSPRTAGRAARALERRWTGGAAARWRERLLELLAATGRYGGLAASSWRGLLLSLLAQHVIGLASLGLLVHAVGLEVGWLTLGWARALMLLALLVPATWGGIGLREATMGGALAAAGYALTPAVTVGLLLSLRGLIEAALGGVLELRGRLARTRREAAAPPCGSA